jgi:hypothetical protein
MKTYRASCGSGIMNKNCHNKIALSKTCKLRSPNSVHCSTNFSISFALQEIYMCVKDCKQICHFGQYNVGREFLL